MDTENKEISNLKTEVAVIKRDVDQINRLIEKMDGLVSELSSLTKTIAVQSRILENHEEKIDKLNVTALQEMKEEREFRKAAYTKFEDIKDDIAFTKEKRHSEILESVKELKLELLIETSKQDERITKLENWKWWVMGATGVLGSVAVLFWKTYMS
jgi:flagellar hook-associated protein FlgK